MQKNTINWFEIPVENFERAKTFYQQVFEFEMQEMKITNSRMGFLPYDQEGGGMGGAIVAGEGYQINPNGVKIYFDCGEDLNPVLERIKNSGGKEIMGKTFISEEIGYFAMFIDTRKPPQFIFDTLAFVVTKAIESFSGFYKSFLYFIDNLPKLFIRLN